MQIAKAYAQRKAAPRPFLLGDCAQQVAERLGGQIGGNPQTAGESNFRHAVLFRREIKKDRLVTGPFSRRGQKGRTSALVTAIRAKREVRRYHFYRLDLLGFLRART